MTCSAAGCAQQRTYFKKGLIPNLFPSPLSFVAFGPAPPAYADEAMVENVKKASVAIDDLFAGMRASSHCHPLLCVRNIMLTSGADVTHVLFHCTDYLAKNNVPFNRKQKSKGSDQNNYQMYVEPR